MPRNCSRPLCRLHTEVAEAAQCVQRALDSNANVVWVNDLGDIFAEELNEKRLLPEHWIVGTYGMGTPLRDIEDDLRLFAQQRAADWILD